MRIYLASHESRLEWAERPQDSKFKCDRGRWWGWQPPGRHSPDPLTLPLNSFANSVGRRSRRSLCFGSPTNARGRLCFRACAVQQCALSHHNISCWLVVVAEVSRWLMMSFAGTLYDNAKSNQRFCEDEQPYTCTEKHSTVRIESTKIAGKYIFNICFSAFLCP